MANTSTVAIELTIRLKAKLQNQVHYYPIETCFAEGRSYREAAMQAGLAKGRLLRDAQIESIRIHYRSPYYFGTSI